MQNDFFDPLWFDPAKSTVVEFTHEPRYRVPSIWAAKALFDAVPREGDPILDGDAFAELVELFSCSWWRYQCEQQGGTMTILGTVDTETNETAVTSLLAHPAFRAVAISGERTLLAAHHNSGFVGLVTGRDDEDGGLQIIQVFTFDQKG